MAFIDFGKAATFVAATLPALHLLSFSTLLGTELYQTFVMTKVSYNALPRSAFTTLQKRVFPIYFRSQTLLLSFTAISFPCGGPLSLSQNMNDWIPFAVCGATSVLNLLVYGPRTRQVMIERIHQTTRDAKRPESPVELSLEMKALNRKFSRNHAMSIHLNLISIAATLCYGVRLASQLDFRAQ